MSRRRRAGAPRFGGLVRALACAGCCDGALGRGVGGDGAWHVVADEFVRPPGYHGPLHVIGEVRAVGLSNGHLWDTGQVLSYDLSGLDMACAEAHLDLVEQPCSVSIHMGSSCGSFTSIGGHLFNTSWVPFDPWPALLYLPAADGRARADAVEVINGVPVEEAPGKVVVVTDARGRPAACGVLRAAGSDAAWKPNIGVLWAVVPALILAGSYIATCGQESEVEARTFSEPDSSGRLLLDSDTDGTPQHADPAPARPEGQTASAGI